MYVHGGTAPQRTSCVAEALRSTRRLPYNEARLDMRDRGTFKAPFGVLFKRMFGRNIKSEHEAKEELELFLEGDDGRLAGTQIGFIIGDRAIVEQQEWL